MSFFLNKLTRGKEIVKKERNFLFQFFILFIEKIKQI